MAGGDGSLASVVAVAIERDLPFVCVPGGTRNHFARDAGLDRNDPSGAGLPLLQAGGPGLPTGPSFRPLERAVCERERGKIEGITGAGGDPNGER